jgi:poly(beta-D-mannuronate) lyase
VDETIKSSIDGQTYTATLPPLDSTIANNLVLWSRAEPSTEPLVRVNQDPLNMTWEGNIMFGATLALRTDGTPVEFSPQQINVVDPLLSLAADGLFRPAATSPVLGAAAGNYSYVTTDMDGQARPDAGKDVGADQMSNDPITRPPLTPNDVGPSWMMPPG